MRTLLLRCVGTAPYTYAWSTVEPTTATATGLGEGIQEVLVTDANGCTGSAQAFLSSPERDDWTMGGNAGTDPEAQFIGTSDQTDLVFKTNLQEALRLSASGNIGIGVPNPAYRLDVNGSAHFDGELDFDNIPELLLSEWTPAQLATCKTLVVGPDGKVYRGDRDVLTEAFPELPVPSPALCVTNSSGMFHPTWTTVVANPGILFAGTEDCVPYVGIGTDNPLTNLHVHGRSFTLHQQVGGFFDAADGDPQLLINNEITDPTIYSFALKMNVRQSNTKAITLFNNGVNTNEPAFMLWGDGRMILGNEQDEPNYSAESRLKVYGMVSARSYKATLTTPIPDYVFNPSYKLMSLADLEAYLKLHKHLPGVVSQDEVEKNGGYDIGQLQLKTLEKTEELFLYIIELEKRIKLLEAELISK